MVVLPDCIFTRAMTIDDAPSLQRVIFLEEMELSNPIYQQDEDILKPWVDAH